MTTISATVIADSVNPDGIRLTTLQLRYPRWIHAEFMTHRQFSRNASSSRAIPVERLIQDVLDDPAVPLFWGKNQKGMQAGGEHNEKVWAFEFDSGFAEGMEVDKETAWLRAMDWAVRAAQAYAQAAYHKQIANRLLEPFAHINVVVTATEWSNFFALRRHPDAEPHIHLLADRMWSEMQASEPVLLQPGEWHLPYVDRIEFEFTDGFMWDLAVKASAARCARVSYLTRDGKAPDLGKDLELYERLVGSHPMHASPTEHQATPDEKVLDLWLNPWWNGNFRGWCQFRKQLPGECL